MTLLFTALIIAIALFLISGMLFGLVSLAFGITQVLLSKYLQIDLIAKICNQWQSLHFFVQLGLLVIITFVLWQFATQYTISITPRKQKT